ncbi:MAG: hypothetical protein ACPGU1_11240 [Myxococcota bacterium]
MRLRSFAVAALLGAVTVTGCDGDDPLATRHAPLMSALHADQAPCETPAVDIAPSLVYDDLARLETRFALRDVLDTLVERAEVESPATGEELWGQWWRSNLGVDPANPVDEPRCGDGEGADRNGFPIVCDRPEADFGLEDPENPNAIAEFLDAHEPVQLVNRFDLMPLDGSHCGEYRMVFALKGQAPLDGRNLIIFEGVVPNPEPSCGAAGCRPIVTFWADLSAMTDEDAIADALQGFYFDGLPEHDVVPVIRPEAYGVGTSVATGYNGPTGQIRTNQFFHPGFSFSDWTLREYSLERMCTTVAQPVKPVLSVKKKKRLKTSKQARFSSAKALVTVKPITVTTCTLIVRPQPVANNPDPSLLNGTDDQVSEFQSGRTEDGELISDDSFIAQLSTMIHTELDEFGNWPAETLADVAMATAPRWDAAESIISGATDPYVGASGFMDTIAAELPALGTYEANHIIARATMNSCGGCHQLSNNQTALGNFDPSGEALVWPNKTTSFVHINEDGTRSNVMDDHFLPHRFEVMLAYLDVTCDACLEAPLLRTTDGKLVTSTEMMQASTPPKSVKGDSASASPAAAPKVAKDVIELGGSATLSGSRTH